MFGSNAISINDCSRLNQSFEDAIKKSEINEVRANKSQIKPSNFVTEALKGLSKSFISSDFNEVRLSKHAKSILIASDDKDNEDNSTINFLTPLTIDKLFLDRLLTDGPESAEVKQQRYGGGEMVNERQGVHGGRDNQM